MREEFTPRVTLGGVLLPMLIGLIVIWLLGAVLVGALVGWQAPNLRSFAFWIGLAIMAPLCALLVAGRLALSRKAAAKAALVVDDTGMLVRYGGSERHLAWADIEGAGQIRLPALQASTKVGGGRGVITATNALNRATAGTASGIIGPGSWWRTPESTFLGQQFDQLIQSQFGMAPDGRPIVPIWFHEYGDEAKGRLEQVVHSHRPDLQAGQSTA